MIAREKAPAGDRAPSGAAERAYEAIKAGIVDGSHAAGERLREEELSAQLGVSRTPVRQALQRLHAEGYVNFSPRRGAQVVVYTVQDTLEILQMRLVLDPLAARLAAHHITAGVLAELETIMETLDRIDEVNDQTLDDLVRANREYHRLLGQASGNTRLAEARLKLIDAPIIRDRFRTYTQRQLLRAQEHHRELLEALTAGDPEWAATVAGLHVRSVLSPFLDLLAPRQELAQPAERCPGPTKTPPQEYPMESQRSAAARRFRTLRWREKNVQTRYFLRCVSQLLRVIGLRAGICPGSSGGRTIMKRTISEEQVVPAVAGETAPAVPEAARRPLRELMDDRLLDALLERSRDQAGGLRLTGEGSMLGELVRAVLERALESELTAHLGYDRGGRGGAGGNARNGAIGKTVQTGVGPVPLQVPRDRAGTFEPVLSPSGPGGSRAASTTW